MGYENYSSNVTANNKWVQSYQQIYQQYSNVKPRKEDLVYAERNQSSITVNILSLLTLGHYGVKQYRKQVKSVNDMSKLLFGDSAKKITYSEKIVGISMPLFFIGGLAIIFFALMSLIYTSFVFPLLAISSIVVMVISLLIWTKEYLKIVKQMKYQLIPIAVMYGRFDIAELLDSYSIYSQGGNKIIENAYNTLIDKHNERVRQYYS